MAFEAHPGWDVWRELQASVDRDCARLEARFGTCPVCHRNASAAISVSEIVWSVCKLCGVRWYAGTGLLAPVDSEDDLAAVLESLAGYEEIEPGISLASKTKTTAKTKIRFADPSTRPTITEK